MPSLFNLTDIVESFRAVASTFTFRRDNASIDSIVRLEHFVATRSAFVAQKCLYGYLQTRIGTRYPKVFADPVFVRSINIAKFHVFEACLSDLGIYVAAQALSGRPLDDEMRRKLALGCFHRGLTDNSADIPAEFSASAAETRFCQRLGTTPWTGRALHRDNFDQSPVALLKWAPIAPELKGEDEEIIENSIRFAWRDIREQFQKRLDADALFAEFLETGGSAEETSRMCD